MSLTLGAASKLLDNMMVNYSEWHTERASQGKKVNFVEETSSLSDKIDTIMAMLANDRTHVDPNNVPLASLVAQEEQVDVNFIRNNNFNNNAYRNNFASNNYRPYPSTNGNGYGNSYGNSYNNTRAAPSELEVMLKDFIGKQTAFNKSVEEKLGKIDTLASKVDSLACRCNGYRGIPVHLLLGPVIGPSSAQERINDPSLGEDPHEEVPREENDDGNC